MTVKKMFQIFYWVGYAALMATCFCYGAMYNTIDMMD